MADSTHTEYMLSTVDNPYNPFTEYDAWHALDVAFGYNSAALLARIALSSDELSELDQDLATEQAINEIVEDNASGMHRKVSRSTFED